jgi:hypothetical protein
MKHKIIYSSLFIIVLIMIVGYSSYITSITLGGSNILQINNDFNVIFTNISTAGNATLSDDKTTITYESISLVGRNKTSTISYRITNYSSNYDADVSIELLDENGNQLSPRDYTITVTDIQSPIIAHTTSSNGSIVITSNINNPIAPTIIIKMNVTAISRTSKDNTTNNVGQEWIFDYTGREETLTIPYTGSYKLEVWGGQGGNCYKEPDTSVAYPGGYGGYSTGTINLNKNDKLYINVGGHGTWKHATGSTQAYLRGAYNGGGDAIVAYNTNYYSAGAGGGATHIATRTGLLSALENYQNNIIIVAGGGGGALSYYDPNYPTTYKTTDYEAHAGGFKSNSALHTNYGSGYVNHAMATPATQISGGAADYRGTFGKGATISSSFSSGTVSGGGGGYYGGGSGLWGGSSGGSSYIGHSSLYDKHMTCYNCEESNTESTYTVSNTCYSDDPVINCSKRKAGYARITFIG